MPAFYVPDDDRLFLSQAATGSPWGAGSQHGGPPAALLLRAIENLHREAPRVVGRLTMELLGPVPVGPLRIEAAVVRPGRSVEMCEATVYDAQRDRACAQATAWLFPTTPSGAGMDPGPPTHRPSDGVPKPRPESWWGGYLDAIDWRWVRGAITEPGPGVVWMRPTVELVSGETMTPLQRLMCCVDSGSGVSAALDPTEWGFLNTELTVHVLRPPVGEWICLDAETTLGPGSVGMAVSNAYDEHGLVARSAQALLVARRTAGT